MARLALTFLSALILAVIWTPTFAAPMPTKGYHLWLNETMDEAVAQGIPAETVHKALDGLLPDERVLKLDQKQPEKTATLESYLKGVVSEKRVSEGRKLYAENAELLGALSQKYGVPAEVIVALWGIESNYGRNTGNYSVIQSLLTLAYEGRRAAFFKKELFAALRILSEEQIDAENLRGSWAGAMGQCQFMPSTYLGHAVDFDNNSKRDIWNNTQDVLASIANYISFEGWQPETPWGHAVRLKSALPESEIGLTTQYSLQEWQAKGLNVPDETLRINPLLQASLIQPDGPDGRSFLVYDSFRALMKWNRSTYFATAVGLLADRIKQ